MAMAGFADEIPSQKLLPETVKDKLENYHRCWELIHNMK